MMTRDAKVHYLTRTTFDPDDSTVQARAIIDAEMNNRMDLVHQLAVRLSALEATIAAVDAARHAAITAGWSEAQLLELGLGAVVDHSENLVVPVQAEFTGVRLGRPVKRGTTSHQAKRMLARRGHLEDPRTRGHEGDRRIHDPVEKGGEVAVVGHRSVRLDEFAQSSLGEHHPAGGHDHLVEGDVEASAGLGGKKQAVSTADRLSLRSWEHPVCLR